MPFPQLTVWIAPGMFGPAPLKVKSKLCTPGAHIVNAGAPLYSDSGALLLDRSGVVEGVMVTLTTSVAAPVQLVPVTVRV